MIISSVPPVEGPRGTYGTRDPKPRPQADFSQALGQTKARGAAHVVRRGDTLWDIVASALQSRNGVQPSAADIHRGVHKVAQSNGIADPDFIFVNQELDLSALHRNAEAPSRTAVTKASGMSSAHADRVDGPVWTRLIDDETSLTSTFGYRADPLSNRTKAHHGIDLAAERGAPIRAYKEGIVQFSGWQRGYGNVVIVGHPDGAETVYAHNKENLVEKGQQISRDTILAMVGSTGRSTGPHLHFEVRQDGERLDPLTYMAGHSFDVSTGP